MLVFMYTVDSPVQQKLYFSYLWDDIFSLKTDTFTLCVLLLSWGALFL